MSVICLQKKSFLDRTFVKCKKGEGILYIIYISMRDLK